MLVFAPLQGAAGSSRRLEIVTFAGGFESRLIERSLATELAGEVHLTYEPNGIVCLVRAPLDGEYTALEYCSVVASAQPGQVVS